MKEGQRQGKGGQLETPHPVTISDTHCLLSRFRRCTALGRTTLYYTALYYIAKYRDVQHTVESNGTVLQLEQSYATPGPHSNTAVQCSALQCSAYRTPHRATPQQRTAHYSTHLWLWPAACLRLETAAAAGLQGSAWRPALPSAFSLLLTPPS